MKSKILLVDDEKDIADLLEEVLRKEGFSYIRKASCKPKGAEPGPFSEGTGD